MTSDGQRGGQTESASLAFAAKAHSVSAVQKAAYRYCNLVAVDIEPTDQQISCRFHFLKPTSPEQVERFLNDFRIEVLDQDLRAQVAEETAATRNAILALAFSRAGLQGGE